MASGKLALAGIVNAAGVAVLRFQPFGRQHWTVQQVTVNGSIRGATPVGSGATCALYINGDLITRVTAQAGTASGLPYVSQGPGERFTIEWASAAVGAAVSALVLYDDGEGNL